ncbi:type III PLP-dependent enzyme [Magnetospirillum sp. SS-4]|uniref:type III PLP-dependent enzyme n=1 Tax=Magnetospirillum sp. SS-4 TaxID=2681465 RepID=UPI00138628BD|nr:type III PLP-dependent enzyme [Magnetospirillum sp. SS-4]CAA7622095.1 Orn/DAP/Arg decarboxylase 2 [Magnetospirillum sp. SS-4]
MIGSYPTVARFIQAEAPDAPVHLLRPHRLARAARDFIDGFPGDTLFAVKCNAHPLVLRTLWDEGIRHFDVASPVEIGRVAETLPGAAMFYHHPAKTPGQIALAWDRGVRHFAVDCPAELEKVADRTGPAMVPVVRLAIPKGSGAVYDLSTKFGATPEVFIATLGRAAAMGFRPAVTFHVGSQCLDPAAFRLGLGMAVELTGRAGVAVELIDVGGGFPAYYRATRAPPLAEYFRVIRQAHAELTAPLGIRLACEPGRALVAEGGSLLVRVVLRKPDAVHLNDGIFGGLTETYWGKDELLLPLRVISADGSPRTGAPRDLTAYGPTCDGNDVLPWPVSLPDDTVTGDYIEFNLIGAYGREMAASYNGMRSDAVAVIETDFAGHLCAEAMESGRRTPRLEVL